jgi:hypothetical protein
VRKALNENPLAQAAAIGALAILAAFLLLTRVMGQGSAGEPAATTTPAASEVTAEAPSPAPVAGASETPPPATPDTVPSGEGFEAGPGLPSSVVDAYDEGKTVVLLVVRTEGIDDRALALTTTALATRSEVELIVFPAKRIARYSRIASGVDVNRVPALVVISPKKLNHGGLPTATVSYGFRGPGSVVQAVEDAEYKGKTNLPYYPE